MTSFHYNSCRHFSLHWEGVSGYPICYQLFNQTIWWKFALYESMLFRLKLREQSEQEPRLKMQIWTEISHTQSSCSTQSCLHGTYVPVADLHCQENVSGLQNHTEKGRWLERSCSCWAVPPSWLPSEKTTDKDDKYPAGTPEHQVPATTSLIITTSIDFLKPFFVLYYTCSITKYRKHKIDEALADQKWKQKHAIRMKAGRRGSCASTTTLRWSVWEYVQGYITSSCFMMKAAWFSRIQVPLKSRTSAKCNDVLGPLSTFPEKFIKIFIIWVILPCQTAIKVLGRGNTPLIRTDNRTIVRSSQKKKKGVSKMSIL